MNFMSIDRKLTMWRRVDSKIIDNADRSLLTNIHLILR